MNLTERLDKHLKSIKEVSELNAQEIEKAINKYGHKEFGKLVLALLKPTLQAQTGKFIKPNFNQIKPFLIPDIKTNINIMVDDNEMNREEAKEYLVNPTKYDEEIGNYADTSFAELYDDLCDGNRPLISIHHFIDDLVDYLNSEIKKNYKSFYNQL